MRLHRTLLAALLVGAMSAQAAHGEPPDEGPEVTIGVNLGTLHFDPGYENFNPGIYVTVDNVSGGVYRNSFGDVSVHVGYVFRGLFGSPIDLLVGAVTGYPRASVLPLLLPSIKVGGFRFSLLLPVDKSSGGVHLSYEF